MDLKIVDVNTTKYNIDAKEYNGKSFFVRDDNT